MAIDPQTIVKVVGRSGSEVWLSEIDELIACQGLDPQNGPRPEDVTAGLSAAIDRGLLRSDGLRVSLSEHGARMLST